MAYVERTDDELVKALEAAIGKSLHPEEIAITLTAEKAAGGKRQYTYRELMEEFRQKTELGKSFLDVIRKCARKGNRDPLDWIGHYSR